MMSKPNPPPVWPESCNWKCLTECPILGYDCMWSDPFFPLERVEYPEFFWWRETFRVKPGDFKEPDNPMQTRCPRCLSVKVDIGYPYITCNTCGYNEPLIDYPISWSEIVK